MKEFQVGDKVRSIVDMWGLEKWMIGVIVEINSQHDEITVDFGTGFDGHYASGKFKTDTHWYVSKHWIEKI